MFTTNYTPDSSSSTYPNDSSATSTFDPQFITIPMEPPPNYLKEIPDYIEFAQFDQFEYNILGDESYIMSRASSSYDGQQTNWGSEKGNNMGSCKLIATHSPLQQTAAYCWPNSSRFTPWAGTKHGGFIQTESRPVGQLLLKNCLLKMLPWMKNHGKSSRHYVQPEVKPGFQTANYSTPTATTTTTTTNSSGQHDETARHHMLAERTRRKKERECLKDLRVLLPKSPKKDKVSVLQSAIEQLKELKACKEDLENHVEKLESTNATLSSFCGSGSLCNRNLVRGEGSHMSINTNIHGSTSIDSIGGMVLPSTDSTISFLHTHDHCEHDIHHGTSIGSRASVSINSSLQSDNTLRINVLISSRLTVGSDQLIKVLTCLGDLGLQTLSVESRFEGDIFKAEISTRANKNSSWSIEAQIQDAMLRALYDTDIGN